MKTFANYVFLALLLSALWVPASARERGDDSVTRVRLNGDENAALALGDAGQSLRFDRISTEQGLSGNEVWSIAQDKQGFMWFGTSNGLNRYDGYDFKVFKHDPDDPHSLSENLIRALYTDHTGALWIGTWNGGLNRYIPETEQFVRYQHDPDDPHSLGSDSIRVIFEDRSGTLWIGTVRGGLNRFDRETEQFVQYLHNPDNPGSLSGNDIYSIYEDRSGSLWIATWTAGLNKFDPKTEQFTRYLHDPADPYSLSNNNPYAIYEDQSGVLWIGTWDAGLNRFDQETEQFTRYLHNPADPNSLSHNQAISIYEDQAGDLWIGTNGGGLNRFDRKSEQFFRYQHTTTDPYSLAQNNVVPIFEDRSGLVWFGTFGGGISIYDRRKQNFSTYRHDSTDPHSLASDDVWAVHEDRTGNLWIGTVGGGLTRLDQQTGRFVHYLHDPDNAHSLSNNTVREIYEDKAGRLWLGTTGGLNRFDRQTGQSTPYLHDPDDTNSLSHNTVLRILEDQTGILWIATIGGLNSFDRETGQFTRYLHDPDDPHSLSHNVVWTIYEDRAGDLWVGTESGGLNRFDRETKQFTRYRHDSNDPTSLSRDGVQAIHEDQAGTLWIGTIGGGLNKFDPATGQFIHYRENSGLQGDSIASILEDEQGNLWLGTSSGLSRFNPQTETVRKYDESDGLQGNEFNLNAAYRGNDGRMFFGSVNGLNAFHPADLQDNSHVPPVVITDFQLANEPVSIADDSVLQQAINETKELVLSYQDRVISFEFAALDYAAPEKNRYRYKLEGFDAAWNEVGHDRRFVTYTNLEPGRYVFRVTGSNNAGVWNEAGASLAITITPPWWQTTWFRVSTVVLVVGLVVSVFLWQRRGAKQREHQLEAQVALRTRELEVAKVQAEKASQAKSTLHAISVDLTSISDLATLLRHAVRHLYEVVDIQRASIMLVEDEHDHDEKLITVYAYPSQSLSTEFTRPHVPLSGMPVQIKTAFEQGQAIYAQNMQTDEAIQARLAQVGDMSWTTVLKAMKTWLGVPLVVRDRTVGLLNIMHGEADHYQTNEIELVQTFANQLAVAVNNLRLNERAQDAASAEERNRLARELHDSVTQSLYSMTLHSDATLLALSSGKVEVVEKHLHRLNLMAREAMAEMRLLIFEMRPPILEEIGLAAALKTRLEAVEARSGLGIEFEVEGDQPLPSSTEAELYRIALEGLNNVVKHAQASQITVHLIYDDSTLRLTIHDDGIGFDLEDASRYGGYGLATMKERIGQIHGTMAVNTAPGAGTKLEIEVKL